jgi:hypothetical protein
MTAAERAVGILPWSDIANGAVTNEEQLLGRAFEEPDCTEEHRRRCVRRGDAVEGDD